LSDALRGNPIRVLGDGQVVRSYLYGADAAYWILRILTAGKNGDVVNVGSPDGVTLQGLAEIVAKNFEPSPDILFNTSPKYTGRSAKLVPDITHAQNEYGLSVFTSLDEAVKSTVKWHQKLQAI
jgi:dTDP-glucose 4,6-dehydratase